MATSDDDPATRLHDPAHQELVEAALRGATGVAQLLTIALRGGRLTQGMLLKELPGWLVEETRHRIVNAIDQMPEDWTGQNLIAAVDSAGLTSHEVEIVRGRLLALPVAFPRPFREPPRPSPEVQKTLMNVAGRWTRHPDNRVRTLAQSLSMAAAAGDQEALRLVVQDVAGMVSAADAGDGAAVALLTAHRIAVGAPEVPPYESPAWLRAEAQRTREHSIIAAGRALRELVDRVDVASRPTVERLIGDALEGEPVAEPDEATAQALEANPWVASDIVFILDRLTREHRSANGMERRAERIETGKGPEPSRPPAPPPKEPVSQRPERSSAEGIASAVARSEAPTVEAWRRYNDEVGRWQHLSEDFWVSPHEDPRFAALEALEAFRTKRDAEDAPRIEQLRALRAERQAFLARNTSPAGYEAYMKQRFIPAHNEVAFGVRLCEECGRPFGVLDQRAKNARFCGANDDQCKKAWSARETARKRAGRERPELEATVASRRAALHSHVAACRSQPRCSPSSGWCAAGRKLVVDLQAAERDLERADRGDIYNRGERHGGAEWMSQSEGEEPEGE